MAVTKKRKDELAKRLEKKREASAFKAPEPTSRLQRQVSREKKIEQMGDLAFAARAAGVNQRRDDRVPRERIASAFSVDPDTGKFVRGARKLETDADRMAAVQETIAAQPPIELQKKITAQKRAIESRRQDLIKTKQRESADQLAASQGLPAGSFSIGSDGKVRLNVRKVLGSARVARLHKGNRMVFEHVGLSDNPALRAIQKRLADAKQANNLTATAKEVERDILNKLGSTSVADVKLSQEEEDVFRKEGTQADFLFSRAAAGVDGASPQETIVSADRRLAQDFTNLTARRQGLARQIEEQKQEEINNLNRDMERRIRTRKNRVEVSSLEAEKRIGRQIEKEEQAIFDRRKKESLEELDNIGGKAVRDLDSEIATLESDFQKTKTKSLSQRKEDEKISFIEREQSKDPSLTTAYLANKFDAMNKYDASSDENSRVGQVVDSVLGGPDEDHTKFARVNEETGDIGETFKALKSRVGEFKAKQMQQSYLESKGWDELTINSHNYAQDFLNLYTGDETSVAALADFVTRSQKMNIPDEYIAARLDLLKANPDFDRDVLDLYTRGLVPQQKPIVFGDRLLRVTDDGVEVLASKAGPVQRSTSPSSLTGATNQSVAAENVGAPVGLTEEQILSSDPEAAAWVEDIINGTESTRSVSQTGGLRNRVKQMEKQIMDLRDDGGLGNERFYRLDSGERQKLADFYKVRGMIQRVRELREDRNLGPVASRTMRSSIKAGLKSDQGFSELDQLTQKRLAEFMKDISGAAVSDQEVARLSRIIPNVLMQDSEFDSALNTMEREFDEILRTKLNTFGFRDEQRFVDLFSGKDISLISQPSPQTSVDQSSRQEFLEIFNELSPEEQEDVRSNPDFSHLFE